VPDEAAVFTEPLAAALAVSEAAPASLDQRVLVVGDGALGLLVSFTLALRGMETHLIGHYRENLRLADPYGVKTFLENELPPGDFDLVVEASGSPGGLSLALTRVRPQGTVVMKTTFAGHLSIDPALLVVPEVRLAGSRCGPFPPALRLLEQGWLDPQPLISRVFPLSQGLAALDFARQKGVLKVLLAGPSPS
jgi:threonine dehydrogenase-like Zn-dependent dehydrogenase